MALLEIANLQGHFESDDGFATIDSDRFNQMLLAQPTFTFEEFGISWNLAPQGFVTQKSLAGYKGSATLNRSLSNIPETSAAPEPSAWVVMIAGFGLAGAALRRRRRAAA